MSIVSKNLSFHVIDKSFLILKRLIKFLICDKTWWFWSEMRLLRLSQVGKLALRVVIIQVKVNLCSLCFKCRLNFCGIEIEALSFTFIHTLFWENLRNGSILFRLYLDIIFTLYFHHLWSYHRLWTYLFLALLPLFNLNKRKFIL